MTQFLMLAKVYFMALISSPITRWLFKTIRDSAVVYYGTAGFAPTQAWAYGLGAAVLSGLLHGAEAYLDTQTLNQQKTQVVAPPVGVKVGMIFWALIAIGLLLSSSKAFAQTTERTGFGINPNFVGPVQFVDTTSGWQLLPNYGLGIELGWMDILTTNGVSVLNRAAGGIFEENIGQNSSKNTVNNAILAGTLSFKGINIVGGFQVFGPPLGGVGSSGFVFGAAYDITQLVPGSFIFF